MTPSGQPIELPYSQDLMDEHSAAGAKDPQADLRPQLFDTPGRVLFQPKGHDPYWSTQFGAPFIDEGWVATTFYDDPDTKLIFDTIVKAMQKRFANLKGTLFGPNAYRQITERGWTFGQNGPEEDQDISAAKKPRMWNA